MNARLLGWLCLLGVTLALAVPAAAQASTVWYVTMDGNDANDCLSPATACNNIQLILDKAGFAPGDTIKVADGVYTREGYIFDEVLLVSEDAIISGGWNLSFTEQIDRSSLSAHDRGRVVTVTSGVIATLQKFYIMEGRSGIGGGAGIHNAGTLVLDHVGVGASENGCGIHNDGTLTMRHSSVGRAYRNSGICNQGTLTMEDSSSDTNTGECAGLVNLGTLLMRRSTLIYNGVYRSLGSGGGLCNFGTATVFDSSIFGNSLYADEGWPGLEVTGGGIWNSGTLTLVNTTIAGNFAEHGGGGIYNVGTLTLRNVTLYDNHSDSGAAGLANFGTVSIQNSILAANTNNAGSANCAGPIPSDGYNLLDNSTGCPWTATTGDLLDTSPHLLPVVMTGYSWEVGVQVFYPPAPSSPIIDAGNPTGCTDGAGEPLPTDQRGADRALDGNGDGTPRCDMGTNEFDPTEFRYLFLPLVGR